MDFTNEELTAEEWRPVPGFAAYSVSSLGRVRRDKAAQGAQVGKMISPGRGAGYPLVNLRELGRYETHYVHSLVTAAFLGPREPGIEVNHIDGNRTNNRIENLEYTTRAGNAWHAKFVLKRGSVKLTEEEVLAIRAEPSTVTSTDIANRTGLSLCHVCNIRNRKVWAHLP